MRKTFRITFVAVLALSAITAAPISASAEYTTRPASAGQAREKAERSAAFKKRRVAVAAHEREVARQRVEDKAAFRAREARIAASRKKAAEHRAERRAAWKRLVAHRVDVAARQKAGTAHR